MLKYIEPLEWRKKPFDKKTDDITKMFIAKCTEIPMYVYSPHKKRNVMCRDYGAIRYTLGKIDELTLNLLYDFLYQLEPKAILINSLTELIHKAEFWNSEQKFIKNDKPKTIYRDYKDILGDMGISL